MLFHVNKLALTPYGKPLQDEDQKQISFATLMFTAIIASHKDDEKLSVTQKRNIYRLKQRLAAAGDEVALQMELSPEDVSIIRQRSAQALVIDLFGQVDEFLDKPIFLQEVKQA